MNEMHWQRSTSPSLTSKTENCPFIFPENLIITDSVLGPWTSSVVVALAARARWRGWRGGGRGAGAGRAWVAGGRGAGATGGARTGAWAAAGAGTGPKQGQIWTVYPPLSKVNENAAVTLCQNQTTIHPIQSSFCQTFPLIRWRIYQW